MCYQTISCFLSNNLILPKDDRLICRDSLIVKIGNKQELQQIVFNHSLDIDYEDLINMYKKCTEKKKQHFFSELY